MDPARRKPIADYHPNIQDEIRRTYLAKGPHRPNLSTYKVSDIGGKRKFKPKWYAPHLEWMEYSEYDDAVFCMPCYLFKYVTKYGSESFVGNGNRFRGWNHSTVDLNRHASCECHKLCLTKMKNLMNPKQSIQTSLRKQTEIVDSEYAIKLKPSFITARILLKAVKNFGGVMKKKFLHIKDICCASAYLVTSKIVSDVGNDIFGVLIDKSGDVSAKEQMVVCLRYVDSEGCVVERFLGIVHVKDTSALSFKKALLDLFTPYKMSISKIRGQGYDRASNISGRFGGLRTLIQNENSYAFYVHCFAHQLQLTLFAAVSCHVDVSEFFSLVNSVVNTIGCSNKRQELLRDAQFKHLAELVEQGVTYNLNLALQRCDQDLLNALNLVKIGKVRLQKMPDDGWDILITKVVEICMDHVIEVPDMNDPYYYLKSRHQDERLNDRFDVGNTKLRHCVVCLSPIYKFEAFDVEKFMSMTKLYPTDFSDKYESTLRNELDNYIEDVRDDPRFSGLKGIVELSKQLVATGKSRIYISLYKLVKFALILPVATASVERVFQL